MTRSKTTTPPLRGDLPSAGVALRRRFPPRIRILAPILATLVPALSNADAKPVNGSNEAVHAEPDAAPPVPMEKYAEQIPKAAFQIDMVPIPGDAAKGIGPFWMSAHEITWDAFDVYVYRLDEDGGGEAVARGTQNATRPTKPYLPPDRGLGHAGFATISISHLNAKTFCDWLSEKTGRHYRLPTEDEWEHAARAGSASEYGFGEESDADASAWFIDNSDARPRPVGRKEPNAWGLHDMHGNVAEWVIGRDDKRVTKGGSYLDPVEKLKASARVPFDPAWNAGDPNIPKSRWWLTDGPFIGFRIVRDPKPRPATVSPEGRPPSPIEPKSPESVPSPKTPDPK